MGKGGKGKGGPPPAPKAGAGKSKEEMEAERKVKREAEKATMEKRKADELAHVKFLEEIPTREAADISKPDWSGVKVQVLLAGGLSIVEMGDGKLACLRRCAEPASELIADRVANTLGVRTPRFRLVHPDDEEYKAISEMTARTDAYLLDMPMTFENFVAELKDAHGGFIPTEFKLPIIEKMEFTEPRRSSALLECTEKANGTIAIVEFLPGKGLDQCCGALREDEVRALGFIGALSGLLNKEDCIALPLWKEYAKSLTNMMKLGGKENAIVAIDSSIIVIKDSMQLAEYTDRLQSFAHELAKPDEGSSTSAKLVVDANLDLLKKGGFEVTEAAMAPMVEGLKAGFQKIASSLTSGDLNTALVEAEAASSKIVPWKSDAPKPSECVEFVRATASAIADRLKGPAAPAAEAPTDAPAAEAEAPADAAAPAAKGKGKAGPPGKGKDKGKGKGKPPPAADTLFVSQGAIPRSSSGNIDLAPILYHCQKEGSSQTQSVVPCERASLNEDDAFVLDAGAKIYVYFGEGASPFEKSAANLHAENIEQKRGGNCQATHDIDDRFWEILGGKPETVF